ncbi:capsular biosynthesis protein [Paenibacillus elgii]
MRIVVDLDGTICELKRPEQSYGDVLPLPGAVAALQRLKAEGHEIIIHTARNMKTQGGNAGKAVAHIGALTLTWLEKHEVPYDEIVFGKPYGHVYIDDLAMTFRDWPSVMTKLEQNGGRL